MREIKFRGKSPCFNTWLYGDLVRAEGTPFICEKGSMEMDGHHIRQFADRPQFVKEDTIGQFTGFCDIDSKEIYEGDIIRCTLLDQKERIGVVTYHKGCFWFICNNGYSDEYLVNMCDKAVIGNIYDNSDLLNND